MAIILGDCPPIDECFYQVSNSTIQSYISDINTAYVKFTYDEFTNLFGQNNCYCQGGSSPENTISIEAEIDTDFEVEATGSLANTHCGISVGGDGSTQNISHSSKITGETTNFLTLYLDTIQSSTSNVSWFTKFFDACGTDCFWNDCACMDDLPTTNSGSASFSDVNPYWDHSGVWECPGDSNMYFNTSTKEYYILFNVTFLEVILLPYRIFANTSPAYMGLQRVNSNDPSTNLTFSNFSVFSKQVTNIQNLKWQLQVVTDYVATSCFRPPQRGWSAAEDFTGTYSLLNSFTGSLSINISKSNP